MEYANLIATIAIALGIGIPTLYFTATHAYESLPYITRVETLDSDEDTTYLFFYVKPGSAPHILKSVRVPGHRLARAETPLTATNDLRRWRHSKDDFLDKLAFDARLMPDDNGFAFRLEVSPRLKEHSQIKFRVALWPFSIAYKL